MSGVEVESRSSETTGLRADSPPRQSLQITVIGNAAVSYRGESVKIKSRKSLAVLAYIALSESREETRERLVGLFWSETEEEKARASLRQTLRDLRRCFADVGYDGLQTEKLSIELDSRSIAVDFWDVLAEAAAKRVHPKLLEVPRLADRLLANLDDIDPSFRTWVLAKRQTFNDRLLRLLEDALRSHEVDAEDKKRIAEALISLDPTHEEACRSLMRARAQEGDIAAALRIYKSLWDLLGDEYDMEPSARTQALVAEIKQGTLESSPPMAPVPGVASTISSESAQPYFFNESSVGRRRPETAAVAPRKIALLVSQFQMNGVSSDKVHLVHGFRHHLIASLIRFREWSVVDDVNTRVQRKSIDAAQYSIDATAYETTDAASIVLTLRQNETNSFIWSETFELKLENWFEAQQRVIRRITTSLNVQLSTERLMRLAGEPDVSLEVYDRWLRGQEMIFSFRPDNWKRAAQIFADVIRDAPAFSSSYNSLVQLNNTVHFSHPGVFRDLQKAKDTITLARTAVQLDPVDFRAQLHLGWSLAMAAQYAEAEVHMDLARELNENDPWTLMSSGLFYAFCGKLDLAARLAGESLARTPSPSPAYLGYQAVIHFLCGNYQGTLEASEHGENITVIMPAWRAAALHHLGRNDESSAEVQRFLNGARSNWFGANPPTDLAIARWLLQAYPIGRREDWERLRDGIHAAGVPIGGIEYREWYVS